MRSIGRMVAMGGVAVALITGGAAAAQASEPWHTTACGADKDKCINLRNISQHNGFVVTDLFWLDPEATCTPETSCGGGWQFQWRWP
ncbi:hypothetical protein OG474_07740 [Kribbella sp. NBC_01505]|uniref:hypothetical protein n=1 Tax=Kribbella sp. NBC_01505 TaxID=2903580 RepID=UPI00386463BE